MKRFFTYFFIIWGILHSILFLSSGNFPFGKNNNFFFPFEAQAFQRYYSNQAVVERDYFDLSNYDISEFIIYAVVPSIIFLLTFVRISLVTNYFKKINFKLDKFTQRYLSVYLIWLVLHTLFLLIGNSSSWASDEFWPFHSGKFLDGITDYYSWEEFIFYAFVFPLIFYFALRLWFHTKHD